MHFSDITINYMYILRYKPINSNSNINSLKGRTQCAIMLCVYTVNETENRIIAVLPAVCNKEDKLKVINEVLWPRCISH